MAARYIVKRDVWDDRAQTWRETWKPITLDEIKEWHENHDAYEYTDLAGFIESKILNEELQRIDD